MGKNDGVQQTKLSTSQKNVATSNFLLQIQDKTFQYSTTQKTSVSNLSYTNTFP